VEEGHPPSLHACSPASGRAITPTSATVSGNGRRCGRRSFSHNEDVRDVREAAWTADRSGHDPGYRFIAYLQDHDQIGNRADGDRLTATLSPAMPSG